MQENSFEYREIVLEMEVLLLRQSLLFYTYLIAP